MPRDVSQDAENAAASVVAFVDSNSSYFVTPTSVLAELTAHAATLTSAVRAAQKSIHESFKNVVVPCLLDILSSDNESSAAASSSLRSSAGLRRRLYLAWLLLQKRTYRPVHNFENATIRRRVTITIPKTTIHTMCVASCAFCLSPATPFTLHTPDRAGASESYDEGSFVACVDCQIARASLPAAAFFETRFKTALRLGRIALIGVASGALPLLPFYDFLASVPEPLVSSKMIRSAVSFRVGDWTAGHFYDTLRATCSSALSKDCAHSVQLRISSARWSFHCAALLLQDALFARHLSPPLTVGEYRQLVIANMLDGLEIAYKFDTSTRVLVSTRRHRLPDAVDEPYVNQCGAAVRNVYKLVTAFRSHRPATPATGILFADHNNSDCDRSDSDENDDSESVVGDGFVVEHVSDFEDDDATQSTRSTTNLPLQKEPSSVVEVQPPKLAPLFHQGTVARRAPASASRTTSAMVGLITGRARTAQTTLASLWSATSKSDASYLRTVQAADETSDDMPHESKRNKLAHDVDNAFDDDANIDDANREVPIVGDQTSSSTYSTAQQMQFDQLGFNDSSCDTNNGHS